MARQKWNMEVLSWSPRAFLFRNFLTEEEIEHMIDTVRMLLVTGSRFAASLKKLTGRLCVALCLQAKPQMQKSTVVDNGTGKSVPSNIRTRCERLCVPFQGS